MTTYKIVRFYADERPRETVVGGLTREQAVEYCSSPLTSGEGWFDGFTSEEGSDDE